MVKDSRTPASAGGLLPMNLPRAAAVEPNDTGEPAMVLMRGQLRAVLAITDRWRIDDEWWRGEISRRYFAVDLEGGTRFTLFQDLVTGAWYQQQYTPPSRLRAS